MLERKERRSNRMKEFLKTMRDRFVGEIVEDFEISDDFPNFVVTFESGKTMEIEFDDNNCEGGYCCATARIENISIGLEG